jgi:hypothetical protein
MADATSGDIVPVDLVAKATVGGSSGSPVFNLDWELVAVHHRGGYAMKRLTGEGIHEANQGSSVFALREEVVTNPQQLFGQ